MKDLRGGRLLWLAVVAAALIGGAAGAARYDPQKPEGMQGGEADFTFAVFADVQEPPVWKDRMSWLKGLNPDFCVIAGDLTPGYTDAAKLAALWKEFRTTADGLPYPYVIGPGNHDVFDAPSQDLWKKTNGPLWFSWNHRGCHFVVLDSMETGQEGFIQGAQLAWLKADLAGAKGARATFVFLHWPLWLPDYKHEAWERDVEPLLVEAGVQYVFCGHEHHYEVDPVVKGIHYVLLGATAAGQEGGFGGFPNALMVEVKGKAVSYRLVTPEGDKRADFYTREAMLVADKAVELEPVAKIGKNTKVKLATTAVNPWKDRVVNVVLTVDPGAGSWKAVRAERKLKGGESARVVAETRTGATVMPLPAVSIEMYSDGERVTRRQLLPVITGKIPGLTEKLVDDFADGDEYNSCAKSGITLENGRWTTNGDRYGVTKWDVKMTDGILHLTGFRGKNEPPKWTWMKLATGLGHAADLRGSAGMSFKARSAAKGPWSVTVEAVVDGKELIRVGAAHGAGFEPGAEWKEYKFYWHEFAQPDWTTPENKVGTLKVDKVQAISWFPVTPDAAYDLQLDDVKLIYE